MPGICGHWHSTCDCDGPDDSPEPAPEVGARRDDIAAPPARLEAGFNFTCPLCGESVAGFNFTCPLCGESVTPERAIRHADQHAWKLEQAGNQLKHLLRQERLRLLSRYCRSCGEALNEGGRCDRCPER